MGDEITIKADPFSGLHDLLPETGPELAWQPTPLPDGAVGRFREDWENRSKLARENSAFVHNLSRLNSHELTQVLWRDREKLTVIAYKLLNTDLLSAARLFSYLHDPIGLRLTAESMASHDFFYDSALAFMKLDEYEAGLYGSTHTSTGWLAGEIIFMNTDLGRQVIGYVNSYAKKYGFEDGTAHFNSFAAISNLSDLAYDYDVFIPIAKRGLFSGAIADLLGLPTLAVEVHAHELEVPTREWLDEVAPSDLQGKRILLLENDAVSGATVQETYKMLVPYAPESIDVYFNLNNTKPGMEWETNVEALGMSVFYPEIMGAPNYDEKELLEMYKEVAEKTDSMFGRLRKIVKEFKGNVLPAIGRHDAGLESEVYAGFMRTIEFYGSLNPLVPGVAETKHLILSMLEQNIREFDVMEKLALDENSHRGAAERLSYLLRDRRAILEFLAESTAQGRYYKQGLDVAASRGIENIHRPQNYTASFRAALAAVKSGDYDVAVIVGPEGFAYEPIFQDLGMETVAVNIPENDPNGKRMLKKLDDLKKIYGKRVLVVEDDVRSGATLKKLLGTLRRYRPAGLGLYLGLRTDKQITENIPPAFTRVFISDYAAGEDEKFFLNYIQRREKLFKTGEPTLKLTTGGPSSPQGGGGKNFRDSRR